MEKKIKLYKYQEEVVEYMMQHPKCMNLSEAGLGKTVMSIETLYIRNSLNTLIICPKLSINVWKDELLKYYNINSTILIGTPKQREKIWNDYDGKVLITNFEKVEEVLKHKSKFETIILDEFHQSGILNTKNKFYKKFKQFKCDYLQLLSATPIKQNPGDLFTSLHCIDNKRFSSYWKFVNEHCTVRDNFWGGKDLDRKPKNPKMFNDMLQKYSIKKTKDEVGIQLPDLVRRKVGVDMTKDQKKLYKELKDDMMVEIGDDLIITTSVLAQLTRLRQLLASPKILGSSDIGGGIKTLIEELVPNYLDNNQPISICSAFKGTLKIIADELYKVYPNIKIYTLTGDSKEPAKKIADAYNNDPNNCKVFLYTSGCGSSYSIQASYATFFVGIDYSLVNTIQCENRSHRVNTTHNIDIYYIYHLKTVEENVISTLLDKRNGENQTLSPQKILKSFFKK